MCANKKKKKKSYTNDKFKSTKPVNSVNTVNTNSPRPVSQPAQAVSSSATTSHAVTVVNVSVNRPNNQSSQAVCISPRYNNLSGCDDLIRKADAELKNQRTALEGGAILARDNSINNSYNGQIAALSVSVAMSSLLPTLAMYYQDKPKDNKPNRRAVLDVIARIISEKHVFSEEYSDYAEKLLRFAIAHPSDSALKLNVINAAIALKHVVRTYNLVKYE